MEGRGSESKRPGCQGRGRFRPLVPRLGTCVTTARVRGANSASGSTVQGGNTSATCALDGDGSRSFHTYFQEDSQGHTQAAGDMAKEQHSNAGALGPSPAFPRPPRLLAGSGRLRCPRDGALPVQSPIPAHIHVGVDRSGRKRRAAMGVGGGGWRAEIPHRNQSSGGHELMDGPASLLHPN